MADKRIDELEAAASVTTNDLFVLEQAGTAKKLEAQTLENWLLALAQGHGGITGIAKTGTAGTNPVVDTYTITFSDTSTTTFDVTNGVKGDTGDQTYVYIKYSNREPIADSDLTDTPSAWMGICATTDSTAPTTHTSYSWYEIKGANTYIKYSNREPIADSDLTDTPSAWMGVCVTTATTAPTTYGAYSWYEIKGDKGDPGNDITIVSTSVMYQAWTSGTQYPTGTWLANPPAVTPGNYLWTRTIVNYSDGGQTVSYSSARWGMDGSGAVASVNSQLPDQDGNVTLTASDVGALPESYQPPVTSVNEKAGTVYLNNKDVNAPYGKSVSATLSSAGWYRLIKVNAGAVRSLTNGYRSAVITIKLMTSRGANNTTEEHEIKLFSGSHAYPFTGEISESSTLWIDKIRFNYITTDDIQYIDIHFIGTSATNVTGCFTVDVDPEAQQYYTAETLQSVADAPTGESVLTIYEFAENTLRFNSVSLPATIAAQKSVTLATIPVPAGRTGVFVTIQFRSANPITKLLVNFGRNTIGTLHNGDYQAATIFYPLSGDSSLTLTCYNYDSNAITMQGSNNYIYYRFV